MCFQVDSLAMPYMVQGCSGTTWANTCHHPWQLKMLRVNFKEAFSLAPCKTHGNTCVMALPERRPIFFGVLYSLGYWTSLAAKKTSPG